MNFFHFLVLLLLNFAVQFSYPRPGWEVLSKRRWLFVTAAWMVVVCMLSWHNPPETKFVGTNEKSVVAICENAVQALNDHPGCPTVARLALSVHYEMPLNSGGSARQDLKQRLRLIAKSWDDSKSYNGRS